MFHISAHGDGTGAGVHASVRAFTFSKIFSETAWPTKARFYMKRLYDGGTNAGRMTNMTAMPIYDKNPPKIFFSGIGEAISTKPCMKHRLLKYYNVYINHDPAMTLTYFTARSTQVAYENNGVNC